MRIFVDTCVWRHWLTKDKTEVERLKENALAFDQVYQKVLEPKSNYKFLYNAKILDELGERFSAEIQNKILPYAERILIPLSRADGAYKADGSLMFGGSMGGSLREILNRSGYDHEKNLKKAAADLKPGEKLFEKKPRKREFDVEHMESALEANADLFITDDEKTILLPLKEISMSCEENSAFKRIFEISVTPIEALQILLNHHIEPE